MLKVEMRELTIIICDLCGDEITEGHISVEKDKKKLHFHYLGKKKCINKYNSEELKKHKYKEILSPEMFNIRHIDEMVERYVSNKETCGVELNELTALGIMSLIGWY